MNTRATYPLTAPGREPHPGVVRSGAVPGHRLAIVRFLIALLHAGEAAFVVGAFLALTGAAVPMLVMRSGIDSSLETGSAALRTVFMGIYAVAGVLALLRWRRSLGALLRDPLTIFLVGFAAFSTAWSFEPNLTLQRSVALIMSTGFGMYVAVRYSPIALLRAMLAALGAAMLISALFGVLVPELGISTGATAGAWQGVFTHKNALGKYAALTALLAIVHLRSEKRWRWMSGVALLLALPLLALSRSQSAAIIFVTLLALLPLTGVLRWRAKAGAPIIAGSVFLAGAVTVMLAANLEMALAAIGRDTTFTGRTSLWIAVVDAAMDRPALGAGYSAFWAPGSAEADLVRDAAGWGADGSHNGFLDVWLELGLVGLALLVVAFIAATRAALRLVRRTRAREAAWPILCLAFVALTNMSEGGILRQNNFVWVLFVMAAATAYQYARAEPAERSD